MGTEESCSKFNSLRGGGEGERGTETWLRHRLASHRLMRECVCVCMC